MTDAITNVHHLALYYVEHQNPRNPCRVDGGFVDSQTPLRSRLPWLGMFAIPEPQRRAMRYDGTDGSAWTYYGEMSSTLSL